MYELEELDGRTREYMLREWEQEWGSPNPYRKFRLTNEGMSVWPSLMRAAVTEGNDETLRAGLLRPGVLISKEPWTRAGVTRMRVVNPQAAADVVAGEFLIWYVRGFAARLRDEGEDFCVVYRAAAAAQPRIECTEYEGERFRVAEVYASHRARYHPEPGDPNAFMIPSGWNCHHAIRRLRSGERGR